MNKTPMNKLVKSQACIAPLQYHTLKQTKQSHFKQAPKQVFQFIPVKTSIDKQQNEESWSSELESVSMLMSREARRSFEISTFRDASRLNFQLTSIVGRRDGNEDTELITETRDYQLACVFDGHGGPLVSKMCSANFSKIFAKNYDSARKGKLKDNIKQRRSQEGSMHKIQSQQTLPSQDNQFALLEKCPTQELSDAFSEISVNQDLQYKKPVNFEKVIQCSLSDIDQQIMGDWSCYEQGSTAAVFVYAKQTNQIFVANIGDSKTILGFSNRYFTTLDHRPQRKTEQERIKRYFPKSFISDKQGCMRLNGNLSLTRSLGDQYMRQFGIVSAPELYRFRFYFKGDVARNYVEDAIERQDEQSEMVPYMSLSKQCQELHYVLISCDGLFEVFQPDVVDDMVRSLLADEIVNNNMTNSQLLEAALALFKGDQARCNELIQQIFGGQQYYKQNQIYLQQVKAVEKEVFEKVDQNEIVQKRITQTLTQLAFLCGCGDNITVLLGLIEDD